MSFVSPSFFEYLLGAVAVYYLVPPRYRPVCLLFLSYGFYALAAPIWLPLLLLTTLSAYIFGLCLARAASEGTKRVILFGGIAIQVAVILGFKIAQARSSILIPLGLSYYSFKLMSYLADVYWDEQYLQRDPLRFFLYPAFFPQILSGPIQRPHDFWRQFGQDGDTKPDFSQFVKGARLILGGLMLKMLIGDRLAVFCEFYDRSPDIYTWPTALLVTFCYPLQLFADFAGYTNIAIGTAGLFGIESPPNFNAPFAAPNMLEYWRRWHMSLTSWMTDYIFVPVNMALRRFGVVAMIIAVTVTMTTIGLWHGLTINFLIFGLLHSAILVVTRLSQRIRDRLFGTAGLLRHIRFAMGLVLTWILITLPMIFWHKPDLASALMHLKILFGLKQAGSMTLYRMPPEMGEGAIACLFIALYIGAGAPGWRQLRARLSWLPTPDWAVCGLGLFLLYVLAPETGSAFIYGQF